MAKDPRGQHWLSLLTPAQYAELFPSYYKNQLPDIGRSLSGGLSGGVASSGGGGGTYTPSVGGGGYSGGTNKTTSSGSAIPEKRDTRPAYIKAIDREYNEKYRPSAPSTGGLKTLAEQRRKFAEELRDPELKRRLFDIMANEQGTNPDGTLGTIETAMNRAHLQGTTLKQQLRWSANGGYYQGREGKVRHDPTNPIYQKNLDAALNGSNRTNFATDNSSGDWGRARIGFYGKTNKYQFPDPDKENVINGEQFTVPGTDGNFSRSKWLKWREEVEAQEKVNAQMSPMDSSKSPMDAVKSQEITPDGGTLRPQSAEPLVPQIQQYMDNLPNTAEGQAERNALQQRIETLGTSRINQIYSDAAARNTTAAPENITPELTHLSNERGANIKGVNPKLLAINNEAARRFMAKNPGYRVIINGTVEDGKAVGGPGAGVRTGGHTSNHGNGNALDVTIIDPSGKALENYQSGAFAKEYQELHNFGKLAQERYFPEMRKDFRAGMYFGGGYGAMDLMHNDINAQRSGMGSQGSWETGFSQEAMRRYGIDPSTNMGMREFRNLYGYDQEMPSSRETATPAGNAQPYINLNRTPTRAEVDAAMSKGVNTFHFDPSQDGADEINKYIQSKGGKTVGYWQGAGDKNYGEKEIDLASKEGLQAITDQATKMRDAGYSSMQIDNLQKVKSASDMKKVFDAASAGGVKVVPNGNPTVLDQMLSKNPEYKDKIDYSLFENASKFSKEETKAMNNISGQVPGYNIEYAQGKQAATPGEAQAVLGGSNLKGVYHYNQGEGENGKGGVSGDQNMKYYSNVPSAGPTVDARPQNVSPIIPDGGSLRPASPEPNTPAPEAVPAEQKTEAAPPKPQAAAPAPQSNPNLAMDMSSQKKWPASQERAMKKATLGGQGHFNHSSPNDYA